MKKETKKSAPAEGTHAHFIEVVNGHCGCMCHEMAYAWCNICATQHGY